MKRKYFFPGAILLIALAGCESGAPISSAPVYVIFTGNPVMRQISGYTTMTVRARKKTSENKYDELAGVTCEMQGTGFKAKLVTPAIVRMPDIGPQTRPATLTCKANDVTRTVVAQPYNITSHNNRASAVGGGVLGMVATSIVEGSRDKSRDSFGYSDVNVDF